MKTCIRHHFTYVNTARDIESFKGQQVSAPIQLTEKILEINSSLWCREKIICHTGFRKQNCRESLPLEQNGG